MSAATRGRLWRYLPPLLIVLLTVGLRWLRVDHGLPAFEEEALPFRKSFALWGWEGDGWHANPHYFNYPSLTLYLQHLGQWAHYLWGTLTGQFASRADYWLSYIIDPTASVILARLMGIAADTAAALAVWKLGERWHRGTGLMAGLLTALAPTLVRTGSSVYTDNPMAALVLWSLVMTVLWRDGKAPRHLVAAGVLAGLAAGAKYPGAVVLLPLGYALWAELGWRHGLRLWLGASLLAGGVFFLSSPFILLDFQAFWHDFTFERAHMAEGHLGTGGQLSHFRVLDTVRWNLGWLLALLLVPGLLAPLTRWQPRLAAFWDRLGLTQPAGASIVMWYVVISGAMLVGFRMFSERYLVALIPLLALVAAKTGLDLARRWLPERTPWLIWPVAAALLVGPVLAGTQAARSTGLTTRTLAQQWMESNLGDDVLIVQEGYGATVRTFDEQQVTQRHPMFTEASPDLQARYAEQPVFRSVSIPMVASGSLVVHVREGGQSRPLVVWPRGTDANEIFYYRELYKGADFFVTSSAMRARYLQEPDRFPRQMALYYWLSEVGKVAVAFAPRGPVTGPNLTVYDLRDQYLPPGEFPPLLWLDSLPEAFRRDLADRLGGGVTPETIPPDVWPGVLGDPYARFIQPFQLKMARNLADLGNLESAVAYAEAIVAMNPSHAPAANLGAWCANKLGRPAQAADLARRCLEAGPKPAQLTKNLQWYVDRGRN